MKFFKEELDEIGIEKQLSRVGFQIIYEEEGNLVRAKLRPTNRFKSYSTSFEDWKTAISRNIEERLVEGKTLEIEIIE
ncbi:hypothetical protein [Bernardetia sp.]|uniref:hypothetical protein n=1 Tax=Bernardetia sp. TaxID=1937974 RepID=UPI0025BB1DAE|nr:hypothetical protein [Bernardetia sp.]